jgi:hypothetical protein
VRNPRAPVLRCIAFFATALKASSRNSSSAPSMSNRRRYCFVSAFFGSVRIEMSARSSSSSSVATTWQTADEFGNEAVLDEIFRLDFLEDVGAMRPCVHVAHFRSEADAALLPCDS